MRTQWTYMQHRLSLRALRVLSLCVFLLPLSTHALTLSERLQGYVLLQVESHGEAWYVHPVSHLRYYLRDGTAAYEAMRRFGVGITNTDLSRLRSSLTMRRNVKGKIFLQVQAHGEAYYVCPKDLTLRYLQNGAAAYQVLRSCSLGITNANLSLIPLGSLDSSPVSPPPSPSPTPISSSNVPTIAGCQIFPADNPWNQEVASLPVHPRSADYIRSIGADEYLHADFGETPTYGIPFDVVPGSQPKVPMTWTNYGDESDPGPYPIPANARREAGGDRHVIVLDSGSCTLYELYHAQKNSHDAGWSADAGAVFDLRSNALRPETWTSGDEAGLPILPGLVRYDEVAAGAINHAIRFTVDGSQDGWIHPATHPGGSSNSALPPMGLRVRMKADYDISRFTGQARVIAVAMKKYGMIVADDGANWYFTGATDARWNDEELNQLKTVPGAAFEAVYTGEIRKR